MIGSRGVTKQRLKLMFTHGPDDHELARCIREIKKKLVAAGAKADNLPSKAEQVVEFVATMRPSAMNVVREWFRKNAGPGDGSELAAAIEKIKANTTDAENAGMGQEFWRAVLLQFARLDGAAGVTDFLNGKHQETHTPSEVGVAPTGTAPAGATAGDADACLAIASGEQASYAGRFLPTLVAGIISALSGNQVEASKVAAILEEDPDPILKKFSNVVLCLGAKHGRSENAGFLVSERRDFCDLELDEPQAYPIYGYVKSVLPTGQIFVKVTGLVVHGDLVALSSDQARELFCSATD